MRKSLLNLFARNARKGSIRADATENVIWLYDMVVGSDEEALWWGGVSPEAFAKTLAAMTGPVTLRINSPGGDVFAGISMAQAIREYPDGVTVRIDGIAASIASVIAIAGREVIAAPGSFIMVHKAWTIVLGNSDDLLKEAALLEKIDGSLADQYRAAAGDDTDWALAMADETWFTAAEALRAGLVDSIAGDGGAASSTTPAAGLTWDLSAFAHPPTVDQEHQPDAAPQPAPVRVDEIAARRRKLAVDLLQRAA